MSLTGSNFIGAQRSAEGNSTFTATNAASGELLVGVFSEATTTEIERACTLAAAAFDTFRKTSAAERAVFIKTICANIIDLGDELVQRTIAETGLPEGRIVGERGRTVGQLTQFANLIEAGTYLDARFD